MKFNALLFSFALGALLPAGVIAGETPDQELCAPFRDVVAPARIKDMLSAAEDGHLYKIISSASRVGFCVDSKYPIDNGEFHSFQGGLSLWPDAGEEELAMIVVDAASLDTGNSMADYMLKSSLFFDVETYPDIMFVSTTVEWSGSATAVLEGNLTLHGVTRSATFQVKLTSFEKGSDGKIDKFVAKASTIINRSDFGIDKLSHLVDTNVELCIIAEFAKNGTNQAGTIPISKQ